MDGEVERFLESWDALVQAIRRARGAQVAPTINGRGLTLSQYGLLQPLTTGPRARVSELSSDAGIAPSTASRILDVLERRELIRRERHAGDRRGVEVSLTDEGRRLLHEEDEWLRGRQRAFYDGLPESEAELAPDLLRRLASLIDELAAGNNAIVTSAAP
ncbi:MAG TPA: MarR family winged helix-turn-helix transcriptional regulator [Solirubrobacteraceae bacterium]|nr:MarR family winged helix-turn-helix transcriptional regulator [Solirubrobacteraceae bacterium]